jgi:hypothetical protein
LDKEIRVHPLSTHFDVQGALAVSRDRDMVEEALCQAASRSHLI